MTNPTRWTLLSAILAGLLSASPYARAAMAAEKDKPAEKDAPAEPLKLSDYQDLMSRNLFSRNQRGRQRPDFGGRWREDPDRLTMLEREREMQIKKELDAAGKGEADIVLRGIIDKDGAQMAFLEDMRGPKELAVKPGDALAGGKVGKITLSSMEYIAGEKTTEILYGFNLLGAIPSGSRTASSAAPASGTAPASGSTSSGDTAKNSGTGEVKGGAVAPRGPDESMLDYLKRKRKAEGN